MWVTHMKTTVELSDELLGRARQAAKSQGRSLRDLIEEGLRHSLRAPPKVPRAKIRFPTFRGTGFTESFEAADWSQIRDEIYRGHGA